MELGSPWWGGFISLPGLALARRSLWCLMVPRLGAATVLAQIVVGQMLGSLVFDHFGLLGIPQHPATLIRLAGTAFLILGVVLIRT